MLRKLNETLKIMIYIKKEEVNGMSDNEQAFCSINFNKKGNIFVIL
jgi:hypothetical protein